MDKPLISVALCSYNGAKFIAKQLDSILAQTYTNLEVVVVDDHSTDDTFTIVSHYAQKDERVKCYQNPNNIGFNRNFEQALKYTTGQYIAISDQDDIWLAQKIERLVSTIGDNWMVFSNSVYIDDNDQLQNNDMLANFTFAGWSYKGLLLKNVVVGHTCLLHRSFLAEVLPFPEDGFYDWWMGFIASYNHKLIYLDEALTQYRLHNQSVMKQIKDTDKKTYRRLEQQTLHKMLQHILKYKGLKPAEKAFIKTLTTGMNSFFLTGGLVNLLLKNYPDLFPGLKARKGLSKINFVIKYARRIIAKGKGI